MTAGMSIALSVPESIPACASASQASSEPYACSMGERGGSARLFEALDPSEHGADGHVVSRSSASCPA
jgi:hypothetical protein